MLSESMLLISSLMTAIFTIQQRYTYCTSGHKRTTWTSPQNLLFPESNCWSGHSDGGDEKRHPDCRTQSKSAKD